nr:hypothetical protein [uncultured Pseudomonas sp.]
MAVNKSVDRSVENCKTSDARAEIYRAAHFRLVLPGGGSSTNLLYRNGKHQLKVVIELILEKQERDLTWTQVLLSEVLYAYLHVRTYGPPTSAMPRGFNYYRYKNDYDTGRWTGDGVPQLEDQADPVSPPLGVELFYYYISADERASIEPHRLMAQLNIGSETIVSSERDSGIYVTPVVPYRVLASQLTLNADYDAHHSENFDVAVYYLTPPQGLRVFSNLGLELGVGETEAPHPFHTSCIFGSSGAPFHNRVGTLTGKDDSFTEIRVSDIWNTTVVSPSLLVRFGQVRTNMRAIRIIHRVVQNGHSPCQGTWLGLDNFGNLIRLRIASPDKGQTVNFQDA